MGSAVKWLGMVDAEKIRDAIGQYLSGAFSFDTFENWIIAETWNIQKSANPETKFLAYTTELNIAEHVLGVKSERDLRDELHFITNLYLRTTGEPFTIGASTTFLKIVPMQWQIPPADRQPSTASELPALR